MGHLGKSGMNNFIIHAEEEYIFEIFLKGLLKVVAAFAIYVSSSAWLGGIFLAFKAGNADYADTVSRD